MSTCICTPESTTTCCNCPSQAEIAAIENMPKEARMKYLRDILLPPTITFTECLRCVVVEATQTTAREYVQRIPIDHVTNQRKVNTELWEQWNIADHERAMDGPYEFEKDIYSAGVELLRDPNGPPPSLSMCYSICSRRWGQEQKHFLYARIGDIIYSKNGTGPWDTSGIIISYALERVDEPRRWNKYKVHHLASENFEDVIRAHTGQDIVPDEAAMETDDSDD
jgi:hypothetical protein